MRLVLLALTIIAACGITVGCIEVAALLTPDAATPDTPNTNGNDSSEPETPLGPFPPSDDAANDNDNADDNSNDNANTNENDNSADDTLPDLPEGAELTTLESGLQVYDFEVGEGGSPESRADTVVVDYVGYLQRDGSIFDSGEGSTFGLNGVIDGFAEGILGMNVGGRRRIVIPPDLGYGENGNAGAGIGGDDVIVFDVTLHSIN